MKERMKKISNYNKIPWCPVLSYISRQGDSTAYQPLDMYA